MEWRDVISLSSIHQSVEYITWALDHFIYFGHILYAGYMINFPSLQKVHK